MLPLYRLDLIVSKIDLTRVTTLINVNAFFSLVLRMISSARSVILFNQSTDFPAEFMRFRG